MCVGHLQSCRVMKCFLVAFSMKSSRQSLLPIVPLISVVVYYYNQLKWNNYHPLSSPVTSLWQTVPVYLSSLMAVVGGAYIRQHQVYGWYVLKYSKPPPSHSSSLPLQLFLKYRNCQFYGMHCQLLFVLFYSAVVSGDLFSCHLCSIHTVLFLLDL